MGKLQPCQGQDLVQNACIPASPASRPAQPLPKAPSPPRVPSPKDAAQLAALSPPLSLRRPGLLFCRASQPLDEKKILEFFRSALVKEAVKWVSSIDRSRENSRLNQEIDALFHLHNFERLLIPRWNNQFDLESKLTDIFKVVLFWFHHRQAANPSRALQFLKNLAPSLPETFVLSFVRDYETLYPEALPLLGRGWEQTELPPARWQPLSQRAFSQEYLRLQKELQAIGFRPIGESFFLERGPFLIELDPMTGSPTLYTDYPYLIPQRISAIQVVQEEGHFKHLSTLSCDNDQHRTETTLGGSIDHTLDKTPLVELARLPLEEQLRKTGFKEDLNIPGLFRMRIKDFHREERELVAFVKNGVLQRIVVSSVSSSKPKKLHFRSYQSHLKSGEPIPSLTLEDQEARTTIGYREEPYILARKILIPLEDQPLQALGIERVKPTVDPQTGFVIGGKNSTELIRKLGQINGIPIPILERRMRP